MSTSQARQKVNENPEDLDPDMSTGSDEGGNAALEGSVTLASYTMVVQLAFRLSTFFMNAVLLRFITRDTLGVVNIRLTLLNTTLLFLAREAFRRACLSHTKPRCTQSFVNLLWTISPLGLLTSCVLAPLWLYGFQAPDDPAYPHAVVLYTLASLLELLGEPAWLLSQQALYVRHRVATEGLAMLARCSLTLVLVVFWPQLGLYIFGVAQVVYGLSISVSNFALFWWLFKKDLVKQHLPNLKLKSFRDLFPRLSSFSIDRDVASLIKSFYFQSLLKQFLTEGERYMMTVFNLLSFADQGVYDIVNNIGSLPARFLFLPLEDSGFLFFSQTLSRSSKAAQHPDQSKVNLSARVLKSYLKLVSLLGLTMAIFGQAYAHLALQLYGGDFLVGPGSSGPQILRTIVLYVFVMALNGIVECFMFATMPEGEISRYNRLLVVFSAIFLATSYVLVNIFGSVGFVLANCVNLALRGIYGSVYIYNYFATIDHNSWSSDSTEETKGSKFSNNSKYVSPLWAFVPDLFVGSSFFISLAITLFSENVFCCNFGWSFIFVHIFIGAVCLLCNLFIVFKRENTFIQFVKEHIFKRKRD